MKLGRDFRKDLCNRVWMELTTVFGREEMRRLSAPYHQGAFAADIIVQDLQNADR